MKKIALFSIIILGVVAGSWFLLQNGALNNCNQVDEDWISFKSDQTTLSFCYPEVLGVTSLQEITSAEAMQNGIINHITFNDAENNLPRISYSTLDYRIVTETDDGEGVGEYLQDYFTRMVAESSENQIITIGDNKVYKLYSSGRSLITGQNEEIIDYFVRNVMIDGTMSNFRVIGSPEQEEMIESLVSTLTF